jgi:Fe-S-cluster containining protein
MNEAVFSCRPGCGACCIAPSISSPLPGMPDGKPSGVVCANLAPDTHLCRVWNTEDYPQVCRDFPARRDACGSTPEEALLLLRELEQRTTPTKK